MLNYCKLILEKVSFDKGLFEKEFFKALQNIHPSEIKDLLDWAQVNYGEYFAHIIGKVENLF